MIAEGLMICRKPARALIISGTEICLTAERTASSLLCQLHCLHPGQLKKQRRERHRRGESKKA
jgi:hypothetical protein